MFAIHLLRLYMDYVYVNVTIYIYTLYISIRKGQDIVKLKL